MKSRHVRLAENGLRQRPQEHRAARSYLRVYLDGTACLSASWPPGPSQLWPSFLYAAGVSWRLRGWGGCRGLSRGAGGLLGRDCTSAARAGTPSPPCMPMRRTWGAAGAAEGKGDPAGGRIAGSRQIR